METRGDFARLEPVIINGDLQEKKQSITVCGVKRKVIIAAVLLFLLIVIFIVTVIIVAVAHSEEKAISGGKDSQVKTAVEVANRKKCPFKTQSQCQAGGCIYSKLDPDGKAVPSGTPYCFYKASTFTLNKSSFVQDGNGLKSEINIDDTIVNFSMYFSIENDQDNSLILEISKSSSRRRKRRSRSAEKSLYNVIFHDDFGFYVQRKSPSETLFDLKGSASLHVLKSLIELTFYVPEGKLYGLGNYKQISKKFDDATYTMWSRDEEQGAHPFYLLTTNNNVTHGLYIETSYPIDVQLQIGNKIKILSISNDIKLRIFMGPTSANVIKQYWKVIGNPGLPPFWGMGVFYGSQQTDSLKDLKSFMANSSKLDADFPAEGIILPGSLNQYSQPFTYETDVFSYIAEQIKNKTKVISTVPPSITLTPSPGQFIHRNGVERDIFIKKVNGSALTGMYKNRMVTYPDFSSSNVLMWWKKNISSLSDGYGFHLHDNFPYSSINGSIGVCNPTSRAVDNVKDVLNLKNLEHNTICVSAQGKKGDQLKLHNKFGYLQASVTHSTRQPWSVSERPFIVSDATSPGIGRYSGHFHDKVVNTHQGLRDIVGELVANNFLGIPMTGPNLCGRGTSSTRLCKAWHYLSVISPISWSLSDGMTHIFNNDLAKAVKGVLKFRQALLHYHYNTLYEAHMNGIIPLRTMAFDYPGDDNAALYTDQVLLGSSILYSPLLQEQETYRAAYLPTGVWCNWVDGACYKGPKIVKVTDTNAPASFVFLKGGTSVLTQNSARTVELMRKKKVHLIVVLDKNFESNGTQYIDDGKTSNSITQQYYSVINYEVFNNTLTVSHKHHGYRGINVNYEKIFIYGLTNKIKTLTSSGKAVKASCILAGDSDYYKLIISDTNIAKNLNDDFELTWTTLDNH